jgi:hypothetical protein
VKCKNAGPLDFVQVYELAACGVLWDHRGDDTIGSRKFWRTPMTLERQVDLILNDCFFALGQMTSPHDTMDYEAVTWLRDRYKTMFLRALSQHANIWPDDRHRLLAVSRYLGQRVAHHAADRRTIDTNCVSRCRMKAAEQRAALAAIRTDESRRAIA